MLEDALPVQTGQQFKRLLVEHIAPLGEFGEGLLDQTLLQVALADTVHLGAKVRP